ncbi:MAG: hypothetical protein ACOYCA_02295 [Eggerthellaceae bacterium]
MKTIKIQLEYRCYPVWIYDSEGFVDDNALPQELAGDAELDRKFKSIQDRYDATFVDTPMDFYHKGFETQEAERIFMSDLENAIADLSEKCSGMYSIEISPSLFED